MFKIKCLGKTGFSAAARVEFEAEATYELVEEILAKEQSKLGYAPCAYGFDGLRVEKTVEGTYKATWYCQASCD